MHARTHEGTGIGLALVQELVRLHGGDVSVQSSEGHRSTFVVSVRTRTAHLPADRVRQGGDSPSLAVHPDQFIDEVRRWVPEYEWPTGIESNVRLDFGGGGVDDGPQTGSRDASTVRPLVLIVDD